ncbi:MAG: hypothetical protein IE913_01340 [Halothiobacillus sp.]|nr:hypothetical protein [Halothiobacillus sp.]
MAVTTVQSLLDKAATVIQDRTNIRWSTDELRGWLNEAYQQVVLLRPEANAKTAQVNLVAGSKQTIPAEGTAFLSVIRNVSGRAVRRVAREVLDDQIPDWHVASQSSVIEHYVVEADPKVYYVYPPASSTAALEIVYSSVPEPHTSNIGTIQLDDRYAPALLDYMLYRAYQKDADYAANDQRSATAYQTFLASLGVQNATPMAQS